MDTTSSSYIPGQAQLPPVELTLFKVRTAPIAFLILSFYLCSQLKANNLTRLREYVGLSELMLFAYMLTTFLYN